MDFIKLAKKRYSVRNYNNQKVEKKDIDLILEAGRVAPTAGNFQPQRLIIVQSQEGLDKLKKCTKIFNAPIAIIVCGDKNNVWKRPQDGKDMVDIDASIITTHMMLQATELGIGTLYMTWFDPIKIKEEFNIPDNIVPVNLLLIGYAD